MKWTSNSGDFPDWVEFYLRSLENANRSGLLVANAFSSEQAFHLARRSTWLVQVVAHLVSRQIAPNADRLPLRFRAMHNSLIVFSEFTDVGTKLENGLHPIQVSKVVQKGQCDFIRCDFMTTA
jgi:hypothetical protein